mgnify:CR=1 FL=1
MTRRRLATVGVLLGITLAGIEGTVVSTAMPSVVASIGGLDLYPWAFTSFLLFAATSMPVWGKLGDIYGRRRSFLAGVGFFVVGSALVGFSQSMEQFVAFRALQGIGGGAMFTVPYTILGVIYPPEERGKAIGWGSAVWGVASFVGPIAGWLIVETLGWRWVFFLPVLFGAVAVAVIQVALDESTGDAAPVVDYAGAALLLVAVGGLLVALQALERAGSLADAALPGAVALAAGMAFVRAERRAVEPILPLALFREPAYRSTNAVAFGASFVIFGAITFVPLYMQSVRGGVASAAIGLFPIAIGWSATSFAAGRLANRVGERRLAVAGAAALLVGAAGVVLWTAATPLWLQLATALVLGVGTGAVVTPALIALQNAMGSDGMGTVTSSHIFFRNVGGAAGPAVFGVVINLAIRRGLGDVEGIASLGELRTALLVGGADAAPAFGDVLLEGLRSGFGMALVVCLAVLVAARFVPTTTA